MSINSADEDFLYIEEINSNDSQSIRLGGVKLTQTVEQLKRAIAVNRGDPRVWDSIQLAFAGEVLDNRKL